MMACCVFVLVFMMVVILPLRYSVDENKENLDYAPVDTAIISFSHPFCDKLTLHSPDHPVADFPIISTIYLLDQKPLLGKEHFSTVYRESVLPLHEYEFWRLYLYPGSSVSYSACNIEPNTEPWGTFYLVKGDKNYERWKSDHPDSYVHKQSIETACAENNNSTFTYEADSEDHYYLIVKCEVSTQPTLAITFTFNRLLYDTSNSSILSECSITLNDSLSLSCHVDVPLSSKAIALLELETLVPDLVDWDANIVVDVKCGPRAWLYALIALSSVIFVVLLVVVSAVIYLFCCRRRKSTTEPQDTANEDTSLVDNNNNNNNIDNDNTFYDSFSEKPE